jgi:hypothetical protein
MHSMAQAQYSENNHPLNLACACHRLYHSVATLSILFAIIPQGKEYCAMRKKKVQESLD